MNYIILIVIIVGFGGMMWWQSRKAKQQQEEVKNFRESLEPGTEIITIGGVIGKVVEVDTQYEEIVIDSEGTKMRFTFRAINKLYTRPAFIDDDSVDEYGNPLEDTEAEETIPNEIEGSGQTETFSADSTSQEPIETVEASGETVK